MEFFLAVHPKQKLLVSFWAHSTKRASARTVNTVISECLYNRGAYVGVLSSLSLEECESLDRRFAPELRKRTKNLSATQTENHFQSASSGGLGYQRISVIIQHRKLISQLGSPLGRPQNQLGCRLAPPITCHCSPHHSSRRQARNLDLQPDLIQVELERLHH